MELTIFNEYNGKYDLKDLANVHYDIIYDTMRKKKRKVQISGRNKK